MILINGLKQTIFVVGYTVTGSMILGIIKAIRGQYVETDKPEIVNEHTLLYPGIKFYQADHDQIEFIFPLARKVFLRDKDVDNRKVIEKRAMFYHRPLIEQFLEKKKEEMVPLGIILSAIEMIKYRRDNNRKYDSVYNNRHGYYRQYSHNNPIHQPRLLNLGITMSVSLLIMPIVFDHLRKSRSTRR